MFLITHTYVCPETIMRVGILQTSSVIWLPDPVTMYKSLQSIQGSVQNTVTAQAVEAGSFSGTKCRKRLTSSHKRAQEPGVTHRHDQLKRIFVHSDRRL
ncbi:hypothetical protein A6R68_04412, partial [Neotoma lepida]